ncbi:MAG: DoxX family protein [Bacteroidetes bacterium GWF2_40_14]|nr:MAG: DoxX family protein [Bacteroidetes bacterium GWF2_40_14]
MKKFILYGFPLRDNGFSAALLLLRVGIAIMIMTHGWAKIQGFNAFSQAFPDPIGLGSELSLILAIGAEFFAAIFVIAGLLTRLSLIPMAFTMIIAAFVTHAADPFQVREMALLYLLVFVTLFLLGPGKYSLDYMLFSKNK